MVAKILLSELEEQSDLEDLYLKARRAALSIVGVQFGVTLLISVAGLLIGGPRTGISAFMGGGIGTLTSLCMAVSIFRQGADAEPEKILKRVYRGEFLKLVMTVVLFGLVLKNIDVSFVPMLGCFAVTLLVYWVALLRSPI
ncbi:MAG: ATP synthase subunit I [Gammaproteobacteria bacterium]|jgi:ATP synthase protein I|nr:hypothetical protein [Gammaproteobacteria bacterium]MCH2670569.1 ATP synthase subunit I [Gammaproteobacteria bacterium]|tara:strand:- start:2163 stop:2585 length:423 start_codon:yes stop_codon:yes gene_type:complete